MNKLKNKVASSKLETRESFRNYGKAPIDFKNRRYS
jgi:hypothetical protein